MQHQKVHFSLTYKRFGDVYEGGDELAIESLFRFRFSREPLTIYKNFKKLPAGSFLILIINIKKWYTLNNSDH